MSRLCLIALGALSLGAQQSFNVNDSDQTLSRKEGEAVNRMIDHQWRFYNRVFGDSIPAREVKVTILKDYLSYVVYLDRAGVKAPKNSGGATPKNLRR